MEWDLISEGYVGRLKDAKPKANSRGFLNPWIEMASIIPWRLQRRETTTYPGT